MTAASETQLPAGRYTDPARRLTFTFEGREIPAVEGQTIAAALYAAGVRIFSRSFKYHRPRGLLCVSGDCPNCLMQVDGRPNVRTCTECARQGQNVCGQNAWPALGFDLLRIFDRLSYFLPVGFYYKRFHKPRWLWPVFEKMVRHIAGLGKIDVNARPPTSCQVEHLQAEVCVIGAGPAGLSAAASAAVAGANVVLMERQGQLGGHLLIEKELGPETVGLIQALQRQPDKVKMLSGTTAFGLYEGNLVGAFQGDCLVKVRAKQIIVCTGGRERPMLFANNDLPGILLGRGVLRLGHLYGVRAGKRAVVATDHDAGHRQAEQLAAMGMEVAAIIDGRPGAVSAGQRFKVLPGHAVVRATGGAQLRAITVARVNEAGTIDQSTQQTINCDLLCLAPRLVPANELLHQGGMRFTFDGGRWLPSRTVPGLLAAGAAAGTFGLEAQLQEGRERGAEAAAALGYKTTGNGKLATANSRPANSEAPSVRVNLQSAISDGKSFICFCEDVTPKDLAQAVHEGFDHIETLKRYATVGMGPCQGKMCGQTSTEVCARLTGRDITTVGTTTSRPPVVPVEMAVLAADRRHHPLRRTPMHHWHQAAGARWIDAGQWKRPESYGDPIAEVRAVRAGVGLIDVSTLGKIDVIGPDAAVLLERITVNGWADLAIGRTRYAVLCTEEGIIFDDGVGGRLAPDHFYLTATTGNAEGVFQWLELWRTTWRLNVTVLNQTSALAAVNLAGPRSRELLAGLTTLDLSPAAFPYLGMRQGEVAGVGCRLTRVGFVGELGYEIHFASSQGVYLWETLIAVGSKLGLKPFGVEAQRILRLEKGHLIVGQDTDALSNPFGAGLGKLVKFAKPQFHGRSALQSCQDKAQQARLVGFQVPESAAAKGDNGWARGLEGCQVVEQGRSLGRVTSCRYSPTLERFIGLAWVPDVRSRAGSSISIRTNNRDLAALVTDIPFYDADGSRLKS